MRRAARQTGREVRDLAICVAALTFMLAHALAATSLPSGNGFSKGVTSWINAQGNRVFDDNPSEETSRALEEEMFREHRTPGYVTPATIFHKRVSSSWPPIGPSLYDVAHEDIYSITYGNPPPTPATINAYIDTLNLTPEAAQSLKTTGTHTETVFRPWGILWYVTAAVVYPAGVILIATLCWRDLKRRKRDDQGRCDACGYDLTGITGPCPECGEPPAPTP